MADGQWNRFHRVSSFRDFDDSLAETGTNPFRVAWLIRLMAMRAKSNQIARQIKREMSENFNNHSTQFIIISIRMHCLWYTWGISIRFRFQFQFRFQGAPSSWSKQTRHWKWPLVATPFFAYWPLITLHLSPFNGAIFPINANCPAIEIGKRGGGCHFWPDVWRKSKRLNHDEVYENVIKKTATFKVLIER